MKHVGRVPQLATKEDRWGTGVHAPSVYTRNWLNIPSTPLVNIIGRSSCPPIAESSSTSRKHAGYAARFVRVYTFWRLVDKFDLYSSWKDYEKEKREKERF